MKKIFTIFIAIAMMLALSGVGSAAVPPAPPTFGILHQPVDILYVYPSYMNDPYQAFPNGTNGTLTFHSGNVQVSIPYTITYVNGYDDDIWSNSSSEFMACVNSNFSGYEWVFMDMVNLYQGDVGIAYANANAASPSTKFITVRTADYGGNNFMPNFFTILQNESFTAAYSTNYDSTFTSDFFDIYDGFGGDWGTADDGETQDMIELIVKKYRGY